MLYTENCLNCGDSLPYLYRCDRKYCCPACKQAAYRKRKSGAVTFAGKRNRGMTRFTRHESP